MRGQAARPPSGGVGTRKRACGWHPAQAGRPPSPLKTKQPRRNKQSTWRAHGILNTHSKGTRTRLSSPWRASRSRRAAGSSSLPSRMLSWRVGGAIRFSMGGGGEPLASMACTWVGRKGEGREGERGREGGVWKRVLEARDSTGNGTRERPTALMHSCSPFLHDAERSARSAPCHSSNIMRRDAPGATASPSGPAAGRAAARCGPAAARPGPHGSARCCCATARRLWRG